MSRFFSGRYSSLEPYTPGEQPKDRRFIKLNTNESPFPPVKDGAEAIAAEYEKLMLYPDPTASELKALFAKTFRTETKNVAFSNGSDDLLNFAFMAFCDDETGAAFPDITYGFYKVFAALNHIDYLEIPLKEDLTTDLGEYKNIGRTCFIANPNAPTGIAHTPGEIEELLKADPGHVVIVDEAYVDFGAESCIPLTDKYDNILVIGTFSKSRSFAGARFGYAVGNEELIKDLNTLIYSTNPYNVNRLTMAAAAAVLKNDEYARANCRKVMENRAFTVSELRRLGFTVTDSLANFVFARSPEIPGEELYLKLKERGILVRHFTAERIKDYNRITIGSMEEMQALIASVSEILSEEK